MTTKTRLKSRFFSLLLAMVMIICMIPASVVPASAYTELQSTIDYITDIGVSYASKDSNAQKYLTEKGYTVLKGDLNKDGGGEYIYIGYKTSKDCSNAITGIVLKLGKDPSQTITYQGQTFDLLGGNKEVNGTGDGAVDLNKGIKSAPYIYIYITRDRNYGSPLCGMNVSVENPSSSKDNGWLYVTNTDGNAQNVNEKGLEQYLKYRTYQSSLSGTYAQRKLQLYYYTAKGWDSGQYLETSMSRPDTTWYPSVSVPENVSYNGYQLKLAGWTKNARADNFDVQRETVYYAPSDIPDKDSSKQLVLYAIYTSTVKVTYDANGGTGAPGGQSLTVKAKDYKTGCLFQSKPNFTIPSVTPTKNNTCKFLGWSTDKDAIAAQYQPGQTVEFKQDTTLYAVYGDHTYSEQWSSDVSYHWHAATCGHNLTADKALHNFAAATCTQPKTCKVCGYQTGSAQKHDYRYSASGNVITETCANCEHKATATLTVDGSVSLRYTGGELRPLKVVYSSDWKGGNLTVSYSNNIDAGQGSGSITIGGAKATQYFTITNAQMSGIAADKVSVSYDGKPHSITVRNVPTGATVTYSTDGKTYTKINPTFTEAGTYTVYYKVEKINYDTVSGSAVVSISRAENSWKTEPSMEGWTYGESAKTPNKGTPKFGSDVNVEYKPFGADDSAYSAAVPTQAGDYKVRFSVAGNGNYTGLSKEVKLTVEKAKVTVKADDKSKTYGEDDPQLTWALTKGTLVSGDELSVNVTRAPGEDVHTYTITASQTDGANPNYDITFESGTFTIGIADSAAPVGLTGIDEDVEGRANGKITGVDSTMQYRKEGDTDYSDITGTELTDLAPGTYYIRYKADKNHNASDDTQIVLNKGRKLKVTVPENQTGYTLTVNQTQLVWNDSVEITFLLKDGYSKLENFAVKVNGAPIDLGENGKYTVLNPETDIEITVEGVADIDAPVISGVADGETHYGDTSFTVTDDNLDSVTVDGDEVTPTDGKYIIEADGQEHTIVATDKSGNSSGEIKITVITIASIDDSIEHLTPENVKADDKEAIEDVQDLVNELINSGKDFTDAEDQELTDMKENIENLLQTIEDISDQISDITDKVNDYDKDQVTPDDKQDIKDLISDIDKLLEDDNLSDSEKEELEKVKDTASSLIEKIEEITNSPATGDDGNIWMWLALLLVSSGGLLGTVACRRKKRYSVK